MMSAVVAALIVMATPAKAAAVLPAWLAGCWVAEDGADWTEECWTSPRAGMMLGSAISGAGAKLQTWETMQIELSPVTPTGERAKMAFWAAPRAGARTMFAQVPDAPGPGLTFVNAGNDFPQRVHYWQEGDRLRAEISRADGTNRLSWSYRRRP
ncbi:DUF6265 family protein [Sphingomonas jatrophae]|uniref:DUF6265 domain-containing protein n=1 Tax=Sphingomonas jatrophae TaxID=1166337 RepID=A0A1I6K442_9SPHN|nr:DUF6265 family protein [Sphingomonas jatrophae]SFR85989.1 hypothetical protein SAMN05192580_1307 [Sphingomonas jatrophae]